MDTDNINNPQHYKARGGIEPIDFIISNNLNFLEGNVVKYVVRAPHKGTNLNDLLKARFYLQKLIDAAKETVESSK